MGQRGRPRVGWGKTGRLNEKRGGGTTNIEWSGEISMSPVSFGVTKVSVPWLM